MRETMFRGRVDGHWWYVTLNDDSDTTLWEQFWQAVDRQTVGQFVGLKDKNGREIYEGDIIKAPTYHSFATGKQRTDLLLVSYQDGLLLPFYDVVIGNEHWCEAFPDFEVIGNGEENPDLLKKLGTLTG